MQELEIIHVRAKLEKNCFPEEKEVSVFFNSIWITQPNGLWAWQKNVEIFLLDSYEVNNKNIKVIFWCFYYVGTQYFL